MRVTQSKITKTNRKIFQNEVGGGGRSAGPGSAFDINPFPVLAILNIKSIFAIEKS